MKRSIICRASQFLLCSMLPLAPAGFRDWGTAMFAELEFIDNPLESLRWSAECFAITLREVMLSGSLGLCHGVGFWITAKGAGAYMRTLRIAAVLAVLVVLSFFMAPSFRQAVTVVGASLNDVPGLRRSEQQELDRLRTNAERDHDAKMLAYVALHEERLDAAAQDADHAVAIDPRWTWVYYVLAGRNMTAKSQPDVWIEKLRQWDPQNAASYLLDAQRIAMRDGLSWKQRAADPLWAATMARAFDSPTYNTYFQQRFDLEKGIARQRGVNNPLQLSTSMLSHPILNIIGQIQYADLVLRSAKNPSDLAKQAKRAVTFGERMMATDTEIEQIVGLGIALKGYQALQPVAGPEDQALISARIAQLESTRKAKTMVAFSGSRFALMYALAVNALIVEVCFALILVAAMVLAGSTTIFIFRRIRHVNGSRVAGIVSYMAVGTMLIACVVAFVAYLPYSQLVTQAMDSHTPAKVGLPLLDTLFAFSSIPGWIAHGMSGSVYAGLYFWITVLTLLSLALLWMIARQFRKRGAHPRIASTG